MKFVNCPDIGRRALSEFTYGGVLELEPEFEGLTESEWTEHLFYKHSHPQEQKEWWYHRPTGMWFIFVRDTLTDVISSIKVATKGGLNDA